ncbi:hypothetical protein Sps_01819 [Shewanella psychrophila]|uniref:Uncharacterized protein n=1 Tax=Shewanella psychrophila TaxID=225848 RepID=A0A1S6HN78_9GAMM|nr:hypothetical protein Sps_01819 [Shewanella psychrophila]
MKRTLIEIMILGIGFNESLFLQTRPLIDESGLDGPEKAR